jgi:nucleoside-diphosphate-sugar epimerase
MKYLVLGSRGQIGLSLCGYLRDQGHEVAEFDIADGMRYDLRRINNTDLHKAMIWSDMVFFLAWDVGGSTYLARYQDTYDFVMNNVAIMHTVFDCLAQHQKPFIFASSQMASMSYSSYGLTKSLAERITHTLGGITAKFWNVYGLELDPNKTHVITDFVIKARDTGVINMRTDGTESRQMLHADDCSRALYILSQRYQDLDRQREYHVTSFEWHTMLEVAGVVADLFPGSLVLPAEAKDLVQRDARNEPDPYILDIWQPKITLRSGITDIVEKMNHDRHH